MGTLEIKLFGALRVQRPGQPISRFPTRRVKDLFSYLLLKRHTQHSREALADLFWDPTEESNPRHCLNTALWRLNRTLGEPEPGEHPYLRVDAQHIGFNTASDCRLDVAEFENRCLWAEQVGQTSPEQRATLYQQAVALYQGDLLVDCYEEWCLRERDRLRQMYLRALEHLVGHHMARGQHVEGIDCALRLIACDPVREDVHRTLMRFYLASSQAPAALRQYQTCQSMLRREFNTEPTPETQALLPEILRSTGLGTSTSSAAGATSDATAVVVIGQHEAAPRAPLMDLALGHDAPGRLADAVSQLNRAVAEFDRAHAQLRAAASSVERLAQRLLAGEQSQVSQAIAVEQPAEQVRLAAHALAAAAAGTERSLLSTAA